MAEEVNGFQVSVTQKALERYEKQVIPYLKKHFSPQRADEIDTRISNHIRSLGIMPHRGQAEPHLSKEKEKPRFLLYKETPNFTLKIIYCVYEQQQTVVVTDFFPVRKHPSGMMGR